MANLVGLLSSEMEPALCISNLGLNFTALRCDVETGLSLAWILLRFCVFDEEVVFLSGSLCLAGCLSYVKAGVAPTIFPRDGATTCSVGWKPVQEEPMGARGRHRWVCTERPHSQPGSVPSVGR